MKIRSALVIVAAVVTACGRLGGPASGPVAGPSPTGSPTSGGGGIQFVLEDTYRRGQKIEVRITNTGNRSYRYNASGYEACDLTYRDETGREFIIPPGTHCDIIVMDEIAPGETVTLFEWSLDECLVDEWGCVESEALAPGTYTIEGTFGAAGGGPPSRARATFEITDIHSVPDVAEDSTGGRGEPVE